MRRAAKRDANEADIVRTLEHFGAAVQRLNEPGCPDLLVGFRGLLFLVEVKLPLGPEGGAKNRTLTEAQVKWWAAWKGKAPTVVRSADEALKAIGVKL